MVKVLKPNLNEIYKVTGCFVYHQQLYHGPWTAIKLWCHEKAGQILWRCSYGHAPLATVPWYKQAFNEKAKQIL